MCLLTIMYLVVQGWGLGIFLLRNFTEFKTFFKANDITRFIWSRKVQKKNIFFSFFRGNLGKLGNVRNFQKC